MATALSLNLLIGSVLSPTLFLLFINDLLSVTSSPIHSYADDSTLHYSFQFEKLPSQQQLLDARKVALEQLTSDLSGISNWAERTWLFSMPPKLNSSISLLDTIFHTTMISSSKTYNSNLHLSLIFLVFLFLVIFLGKITLLHILNKLLKG